MTNQPRRTVGILIFDGVEVLDFCGPFEVFATTVAPGDAVRESRRLFDVFTIAQNQGIVHCRGNLLVQPHSTIEDHPPLDILLVPGGPGTRRERTNQVLLDWIATQNQQTDLTTSVCTGAFLLAANGLLTGKQATTHWGSIDWLRDHHPEIDVRDDVRYVDEGRVITSAGVSAGIDMALHIVSRLCGQEIAAATARNMEYSWQQD